MTDHFPDDQARTEFEQWHDERPDADIVALAASLRRPAKPTTAEIAAGYAKLANAALKAKVAYEAWANSDLLASSNKRVQLANAYTQADLAMGEAFAAVATGYDHDWLDTMREDAGLVFDEQSGEWVDPAGHRAAQHEARSYADTAAHAWSAR